MGSELSSINYRIRVLNNRIDDKEDYIRSKRRTKEQIEDIIREYYVADNRVTYINRYLDKVSDEIQEGIYLDSGYYIDRGLDQAREKDSNSDEKLTEAISELRREISNINSQIEDSKGEIRSLERELSDLKRKRRELLFD